MLDKIKTFIKENPVIAIIGGGILLFFLYLLFSRLFKRDEIPAGQPLQVIPGQRFEPPAPQPPAPQPIPGEIPQWQEQFRKFQETMRKELEGVQRRLRREGRDVRFVQEIIREHLPPVTPAPVAPAPAAPVAPAPAAHVAPAAPRVYVDRDWFEQALRKIERAGAHPDAIEKFRRIHIVRDTPAPVAPVTPTPVTPAPVAPVTPAPAPIPVAPGVIRIPHPFADLVRPPDVVRPPTPVRVADPIAAFAPQFDEIIPTPVVVRPPTTVRDQGLIDRLRADIARVEAQRHLPHAKQYFQRKWGGIDAYLTSQRERLRRALG